MNAEMALEYLTEMSTDVKRALIVSDEGRVLSSTFKRQSEEAAAVLQQVLDRVTGQGTDHDTAPYQMELAAAGGSVFITLGERHVLVAVTGRSALPALILYDMHTVISEIEAGES